MSVLSRAIGLSYAREAPPKLRTPEGLWCVPQMAQLSEHLRWCERLRAALRRPEADVEQRRFNVVVAPVADIRENARANPIDVKPLLALGRSKAVPEGIRPEVQPWVSWERLKRLGSLPRLLICVFQKSGAHLTQLRDLGHMIFVSLLGVGGLDLHYILERLCAD